MANESIVSPAAAEVIAAATPPAPAAPAAAPTPPDPAAAPASDPPAGDPATPPAGDPPPDPAQMVPRSRIDREVREKWEARRRADALESENARLRAMAGGAPAPAPDPAAAADPATLDQLVQSRAEQIARAQDFDRRCNDVAARGKKEFPDFDQAVANFGMFGGLGAHPDFVDAVTQLDDSPAVLHYLGTHPDEAERVMGLRGAAQGVALGHLSARLGAAPAKPAAASASRAPAPVAPVRGTAAPQAGPDDKGNFSSQESFRAWRESNYRKR